MREVLPEGLVPPGGYRGEPIQSGEARSFPVRTSILRAFLQKLNQRTSTSPGCGGGKTPQWPHRGVEMIEEEELKVGSTTAGDFETEAAALTWQLSVSRRKQALEALALMNVLTYPTEKS